MSGYKGDGVLTFAFNAKPDATSIVVMQSTDNGSTWTESNIISIYKNGSFQTGVTILDETHNGVRIDGLVHGITYKFKMVIIGGSYAGNTNVITHTY
ncbi:hypothetical protein SAMN05880501_101187 [Ureibacillus xyleni]|uniref:Uncharacterized protein n=1 Tax=Ureibacillus xyleni TaxID=614648 RepID=A0A285RA99_9BACL|nr:hypothetical protein [Ureibacillus xyleni]SOB90619.1 hypothetical protein SAMN05880501_101187 [Ureibacillus xyleni]